MIKISEKILQLNKPNGIFIVFGEYNSEEYFSDFLEFIHQRLGAEIGVVNQHPYSTSAIVVFPFGKATAIFQDGIGCAIRINPEEEDVMKNVVTICRGCK